jgi:phage terminase large subunit-like protein
MYDENKAERVIKFIERVCTHVKGDLANKSFLLEDWQKDYIRDLFGTVNEDGTRQYRTSFVFIPRKNGKSNLLAAIGLALLFVEKEPGAEIYVCASSREQANAIFDVCKQMIRNQPVLERGCKVYRNSIVLNGSVSFLKAVAADAGVLHGANASAVLYDEVHSAKNRELWDVMATSMGARSQPLMFGISTAGLFDPNSVCYELYDYGKKVRDGIIEDDTFLPLIYELEPGDDIHDEEVWKKANPNYGVSIKPEYFRKMSQEAKSLPSSEIAFRQLHLNQWVNSLSGWIPDDEWMNSAGEVNLQELVGKPCYGGLDLAAVEDVTAFVLIFPWEDGSIKVLPYLFVSEAAVERRRVQTGGSYDSFVSKGELIVTDGNSTDYSVIKNKIIEAAGVFDIQSIAFDRWNSNSLVQQLMDEGLDMDPFGQGFVSMSGPIKNAEVLIKSGKLHHGGNSMLRWMVGNVVVKKDDAENIKFSKAKAGDKIDGVVAMIMALGEKMTVENSDVSKTSAYESREMRFL